MRSVAALPGCSVRAIAPVPYCPPLPLPRRYADYARVPLSESRHGITVDHPRYPVIPIVGLRLQGAGLLTATLRHIALVVARERVDVIDAHYLYPDGFAAVEAARRIGIPAVVSALGTDVYSLPSMPGISALARRTVASATMLIAVSRSIAEGLVDLGADARKIVVVPNGIDAGLFAPDPLGAVAVRERLGIGGGEPLVLAVGRLHRVKGHDVLIDAFARLPARMRLAIVGDGALRADLERQIRARGLASRVTLVGDVSQEQLPAWYTAADLFCLPSRGEGHPNALVEALACGTPAVASAVGAVPEVIRPSCGLVVPAGDPAALALAIQGAIAAKRDGLYTRDSVRSAVTARSWTDVAEEVRAVFEEATRGGRLPRDRSARS